VQTFYRHAGEEVKLGTTQRREAQSGQGHGKGAASPARRGSAVGNRWPRGARVGHGWIRGGEGDLSRAGRGLSGRCPLARLAGRHRRLGGRRPLPLDGTEQGRG
jgi:hypothetical protein